MPLPVGAKAPDFTLKSRKNGTFQDVTLSDNFGKANTVILFFPGAFTTPCTAEMCDVRDRMNHFAGLNAQVYGISVDSAFAQEAWAEREQLTFPLLSDYKREITNAYGVVNPDLAGMGPSAARAAFVIDKEGVIRYSEQTQTLGEMPNFAAIDAILEQIS